jgi:hypothetical protein
VARARDATRWSGPSATGALLVQSGVGAVAHRVHGIALLQCRDPDGHRRLLGADTHRCVHRGHPGGRPLDAHAMSTAGAAAHRCGWSVNRTDSTAISAHPSAKPHRDRAGDGVLLLRRDDRGGDEQQSGEQSGSQRSGHHWADVSRRAGIGAGLPVPAVCSKVRSDVGVRLVIAMTRSGALLASREYRGPPSLPGPRRTHNSC